MSQLCISDFDFGGQAAAPNPFLDLLPVARPTKFETNGVGIRCPSQTVLVLELVDFEKQKDHLKFHLLLSFFPGS